MLHALIMAGGGGTRFWPRSRQRKPKQFLELAGDRSLLQQAIERVEGVVAPENTWVITAAGYVDQTREQLPHIGADRIVGEPVGRDTAACIGLGAALLVRDDPDAIMLVTPADHVIQPVQLFRQSIQAAAQVVREHPAALVTFGIPPTFPATGYGYIERGPELPRRLGAPVFRVQSFREKPWADLAEEFVASGRYFWNSGIFLWRAATILDALRANQPALAAAVGSIADAWSTPQRQSVLDRVYADLPRVSIDYAVMEKAREVLVMQAPFTWDDVGSWLALERMHPQDARHNTVLANHAALDTDGCIIVGDADRLIATVGVRDLLVIQDGNAILVAHRSQEAGVKKLVEALRAEGRQEYL